MAKPYTDTKPIPHPRTGPKLSNEERDAANTRFMERLSAELKQPVKDLVSPGRDAIAQVLESEGGTEDVLYGVMRFWSGLFGDNTSLAFNHDLGSAASDSWAKGIRLAETFAKIELDADTHQPGPVVEDPPQPVELHPGEAAAQAAKVQAVVFAAFQASASLRNIDAALETRQAAANDLDDAIGQLTGTVIGLPLPGMGAGRQVSAETAFAEIESAVERATIERAKLPTAPKDHLFAYSFEVNCTPREFSLARELALSRGWNIATTRSPLALYGADAPPASAEKQLAYVVMP